MNDDVHNVIGRVRALGRACMDEFEICPARSLVNPRVHLRAVAGFFTVSFISNNPLLREAN